MYRSSAFILFIFHSKEIFKTKLSEITRTLWQFILLTWKVLIYWLNLSSLSLVCGNDTGNVNDLVLLLYNEVYFLFLLRCMLVLYKIGWWNDSSFQNHSWYRNNTNHFLHSKKSWNYLFAHFFVIPKFRKPYNPIISVFGWKKFHRSFQNLD